MAAGAARPAPLRHHPGPTAPALSAFEKGSTVKVPRYGKGVVEAADSDTVTVRFANGSTRCFLAAYVKAARA